jgi:phage terminase large subunit-like protein
MLEEQRERRRGPGRPPGSGRKRQLVPRVGDAPEPGWERSNRYFRKTTRGMKNWRWIERVCYCPEGTHVGEPIRLLKWEKEFIEEIYDNPHVTRRAILSLARKNGKTTLVACLLLVHLCGPEAKGRQNSQIYSAAQSRDQAALVFNLAAKMIRMNTMLRDAVLIHESQKSLSCPDLGTRYRALSAEATTAYGLSPALVVHDELGQICPRKQIKRLQNMGFQTAA